MKALLVLTLTFSCLVLARTQYRSKNNHCPNKSINDLNFLLIGEYEKTKSLLDLKKKILKDRLKEKYFINDYKISYQFATQSLLFEYTCSRALLKAEVMREGSLGKSYSAILTENGKLLDPSYEVVLRAENKIEKDLPDFVLPISLSQSKVPKEVAQLVATLGEEQKKSLAEVIVDDKKELTMIFSILDRPASVFLGQYRWKKKIKKLNDILAFMKKKKTVPSVINMTNDKKVVVKFSDTI